MLAHSVCVVDCRFIVLTGTVDYSSCPDLVSNLVVQLTLSIVECKCFVFVSESANAEAFCYWLTFEPKEKMVKIPARERVHRVV